MKITFRIMEFTWGCRQQLDVGMWAPCRPGLRHYPSGGAWPGDPRSAGQPSPCPGQCAGPRPQPASSPLARLPYAMLRYAMLCYAMEILS